MSKVGRKSKYNPAVTPAKAEELAKDLLTDAQIAHGHSFTQPTVSGGAVTNGITGGSHTHNQQGWYGVTAGGGGEVKQCRARTKITTDASDTGTNIASTHTHNLPSHSHTVSGGAVANLSGASSTRTTHTHTFTGTAASINVMQASTAVYIWHRTA